MRDRLAENLHPAGWTEPSSYRIGVLWIGAAFILVALAHAALDLPWWAAALLASPPLIVLVLLTIRRLRDAGWSVWWALLLVVNINIGGLEISWLPPLITNLAHLVKLVPVAIGLLAPSATPRTI
jgi:uncharacterized membrane protein YhaH (DUF805 family)